jgi:peptidoglycan hydrolase CwlO-like protein
MSKKAAFLIAGIVTSIVMVLVVGVAYGAIRFNQPAAAAATQDPPATATSAVCANPADVTALQAQLSDYQAALQQANTQLQAAYDEITALQSQGTYSRGYDGEEHSGRYTNPFGDD